MVSAIVPSLEKSLISTGVQWILGYKGSNAWILHSPGKEGHIWRSLWNGKVSSLWRIWSSDAAFKGCSPWTETQLLYQTHVTEFIWTSTSVYLDFLIYDVKVIHTAESAAHKVDWIAVFDFQRHSSEPCWLLVIIQDSKWVTLEPTQTSNMTWNSSRAQRRHQSTLSFPGLLWRWQWTKKHIFTVWEPHLHIITWRLLHGLIRTDFLKVFFSPPEPYMKYGQPPAAAGTARHTAVVHSYLLLSALLVFLMKLRDQDPHRRQ